MKTLFNIICSKKVKYSFILLFLLIIYIFISAFFYVKAVSSNLTDNLLRLHVIANSDSIEDQNLKYKVRDNLLEYMINISSECKTKEDAIKLINNNIDKFYSIAKTTINNNGYDYDVKINVGNYLFPTKDYKDIIVPKGYYDALRVEIGSASGQNWWCVMFPPLCFITTEDNIVPDSSREILKNELSTEEYSIISDSNNPSIKLKFKIIELLQNSDFLTAKK